MLTKQKSIILNFWIPCATKSEKFLAFNIEKDRLDTFLAAHVYGVEKFSTLWNVMMFVFTMFYGQSNVERGFNINDDIVV